MKSAVIVKSSLSKKKEIIATLFDVYTQQRGCAVGCISFSFLSIFFFNHKFSFSFSAASSAPPLFSERRNTKTCNWR